MGRVDSRSVVTREAILTAAERLFAEKGIQLVSNRQISDAAGQGNNAAVGYHFGSRESLLRQIIRRHTEPIEELRGASIDALGRSDDLRGWLDCIVHPTPAHLERLGSPTWYARFLAQVMTDPVVRDLVGDEMVDAPALRTATTNLSRCLPELPADVLAERSEMTRNMIVQTCADRERALATNAPTPRHSWHAAATGLVDALVGLWTAPVTDDL